MEEVQGYEEVEEVRWQEEKRCASDGFYYTEREFIAFYRKSEGRHKWIRAGVVSKEWRMRLSPSPSPTMTAAQKW